MEKKEISATINTAIEKKQNSYISKYNKVIEKCNKNAWELAKVVYDTVNANDFEEVFGTMTEYAKALNVSKSSLSKMAKAYERRIELLEINENYALLTRTHVEEMSPVNDEDTEEFLEVERVTVEDSAKDIREKAIHFVNSKKEPDETNVVEETDVIEEVDENFNCMLLTYKGTEYQITSDEMIEKIKALLEIKE